MSQRGTTGGDVVAVGHHDGVVTLWSPAGKLIRTMTTGQASVGSLAFADAGATLLVGSDDTVTAYSTRTGR